MPRAEVKKLAGVQFHPVGKIYHFDATNFETLAKGDFVIVETTRGRQIGQVITLSAPAEVAEQGSIKPVERIATGRDMAIRRHWQDKESEALALCCEVAKKLDLPIKVVAAEYSFDGSRLLFTYTTEDKIDTHELKREISRSFRVRVDLRAVGPRDVAKLLGGYGACGELRCCGRFLTDFSSISIKMAKEQGVSLNPQEITGMCGRLRCCLMYEYDLYVQARKSLPKRGKEIGTPFGRGIVIDLLPLQEAVLVRVGEQLIEVAREDILPLEEYEALAQRDSQPQAQPQPQEQEKSEPPARRRRRKRPAASKKPQQAEQKELPAVKADTEDTRKKSSSSRRRRRRRKPPGGKSTGKPGDKK